MKRTVRAFPLSRVGFGRRSFSLRRAGCPDPRFEVDTAAHGVHPMLVSMLRSELIREVSDGTYLPPTFSQTIKLRRVT